MQQQEDQLQNVIDLIQRTGDKAIVLEKGKPSYVMMRIKDYEGLILGKSGVRGLTEDELLDKINREIAVWKSDQERIKELEDEYTDLESKEEPDFDWSREWDFEDEDERDEGFDPLDLELPPFFARGESVSTNKRDEQAASFNVRDELKKHDFAPSRDRFEEDKYYVEPVD